MSLMTNGQILAAVGLVVTGCSPDALEHQQFQLGMLESQIVRNFGEPYLVEEFQSNILFDSFSSEIPEPTFSEVWRYESSNGSEGLGYSFLYFSTDGDPENILIATGWLSAESISVLEQ